MFILPLLQGPLRRALPVDATVSEAGRGGYGTHMAEPREPIRYVDAGSIVVDEAAAPQLLAMGSFALGIVLLMGLMAFSTDHFVHGWWWALFAVPAALVLAAVLAVFALVETNR